MQAQPPGSTEGNSAYFQSGLAEPGTGTSPAAAPQNWSGCSVNYYPRSAGKTQPTCIIVSAFRRGEFTGEQNPVQSPNGVTVPRINKETALICVMRIIKKLQKQEKKTKEKLCSSEQIFPPFAPAVYETL